MQVSPWVGKSPWRSAWQPSPVFLPGESHRQRSLVGYSPGGCKESDVSEHACNIALFGCTVVYRFTYWMLFWLLSNLGSYEQSYCKYSCVDFCVYRHFQLLWILRSMNAGYYGKSMFDFVRNCHILSHVAAPVFISTSSVWVPVAPHTCQHLVVLYDWFLFIDFVYWRMKERVAHWVSC